MAVDSVEFRSARKEAVGRNILIDSILRNKPVYTNINYLKLQYLCRLILVFSRTDHLLTDPIGARDKLVFTVVCKGSPVSLLFLWAVRVLAGNGTFEALVP